MVQGIPEHLVVGEPELKLCEAIILLGQFPRPNNSNPIEDYRFYYKCQRGEAKGLLLHFTNMSEARVDRALNLLYKMKRI